jgi:hypothetical protein
VADRKNSFEREISEEIRKGGLPSGVGHATGFYVPWDIVIDPAAVRRAEAVRAGTTRTTTTTTQGKELVMTAPGTFVNFLYGQMVSKILGVQVLTDLRRNVGILKQTGKAAGSWVVENPGADVADTITLAELVIAPHTYQSSTAFTRELLLQSAIEIDSSEATRWPETLAMVLRRAGPISVACRKSSRRRTPPHLAAWVGDHAGDQVEVEADTADGRGNYTGLVRRRYLEWQACACDEPITKNSDEGDGHKLVTPRVRIVEQHHARAVGSGIRNSGRRLPVKKARHRRRHQPHAR